MNTNPYSVLGVPNGASIADCTKAYKKLAKKYHPDLNPNDSNAAEKMAEINAAYDQVKNGTYSQNPFSSTESRRSYQSSSNSAPDYYGSVKNFIRNGQYRQALNLLEQISNHDAEWYCYSSIVYMRLGDQSKAESYMHTACKMEPGNMKYRRAYEQIVNGNNPMGYGPFSGFSEDFGGFSGGFTGGAEPNAGRYYRTNDETFVRHDGCLTRIIRFIIIVVAIRIIIYLALTFASIPSRQYSSTNDTTSSYSQDAGSQYGNSSGSQYFGEQSGSSIHS